MPYGIDANRPAIELLLRYAAEQGLIPRAYTVEELFVTNGRLNPAMTRDDRASPETYM